MPAGRLTAPAAVRFATAPDATYVGSATTYAAANVIVSAETETVAPA